MLKSADKWLPGYVRSVLSRPRVDTFPRHLIFCVADHFEPFRGNATPEEARRHVARWVDGYPSAVDGFVDADGCGPRHTFFYPAEEYQVDCLDDLGGLCRAGHGEVEVHLHHRNDTPDRLSRTLCDYRDCLSGRHGLLGRDSAGRPRYAFIHGNWALCNSRPDGDWCGVNEELGVLRRTGCYADFTFPSAPSPTQPRMVNSIYYARDRSGRPRGHDRGLPVAAGRDADDERDERLKDALMLVQGPLAPNWRRRKWGVLPRLENGSITEANPPTSIRVDLWVRQNVHVRGRSSWTFAKVHDDRPRT